MSRRVSRISARGGTVLNLTVSVDVVYVVQEGEAGTVGFKESEERIWEEGE